MIAFKIVLLTTVLKQLLIVIYQVCVWGGFVGMQSFNQNIDFDETLQDVHILYRDKFSSTEPKVLRLLFVGPSPSSIRRNLFTFSSSPKPLKGLQRNLTGGKYP